MSYTLRRMILVVVAVAIIAFVAIGLVLFIKNRGEVVRYDDNLKNQTTEVADNSSKSTSTSSSTSGTSSTAVTNPYTDSTTDSTSTTDESDASQLPQTGPTENIEVIVAVGTLTLAATYYITSIKTRLIAQNRVK